jgi:uroporphyrinogen decarboxylase
MTDSLVRSLETELGGQRMTSRERIRTTLNHQEPDRVPFDLGGTVVTGIHVKAYQALRDYLGLPPIKPMIVDILQQIAQVDDDVMDRLGVDVKNVSPRSSATYKVEIKEMDEYKYFYDEFSIGWRMPKEGGWYYDMFDHPLKGEITEDRVDRFRWPNPLDAARFLGLKESAQRAAQKEKRAVVIGNMCAGVMEVFAWVRGFEDYFADFVRNPKLACKIMDRVLEMKLAYWGHALEILGDMIDVAQDADDFAGQEGLLISPETYRKLVKPRHKELFHFIHSHSNAKVFFHSCGSIRDVIPDLIEIGVDIINPVQVSAVGMDSAELKREFGKDLVFWGGGVDTQRVLGSGTPQQVREDVKRRLADLMPGGGFVFAAVHNIQGNVPPENIVAMWETLQEYGVYCSS